jgi:hypothetical protein
MKKILMFMILCFSTSLSAQTLLVRTDIAGAAKINNESAGYSALSVSVKTNAFSITGTPVAFLWTGATPEYHPNIEAALKIPKTRIYTGLGHIFGTSYQNTTYLVATIWGPDGFPFTANAGIGDNYYLVAFGFYLKVGGQEKTK